MAKARRSKTSGTSSDVLPLFEFSNVVNSSIDLKFILGTVLLTVMGKMLVSKGAVLLRREGNSYEIVAAKGMGDCVGKNTTLEHQPRTLQDVERRRNKTADFFSLQSVRLVVPIVSEGRTTGYLALGDRMGKQSYSSSDKKLITSLVNLSASAVEKAVMLERLKDAHRNLDRKLQELKTLFELSKEFNLVLDAEKVIRLLTFSLLGQVGVNRYAVCLSEGASVRIVASRLEESTELPRTIQKLCDLVNPTLVEDLVKDKKMSGPAEQLQLVGVKLVIPMQVQNRTKGLILLGQKLGGGAYSKGDLEFLYSLGNLAIISIENARLFQETLEKQRLEDELKIAREIQQGLLPQKLPQIPGYDLAAVNVSSKQVGGDYYDVLPRSETEYIIAIGDVSGKGTPAALLMANVQAVMRALAPLHDNLPETTSRINDITFENTGGDKFITFFWGVVDTQSKRFRYVNAGHNPPFLIRKDGSMLRLTEGGLILGIMKTMQPYKEGFVPLESGDTLFLFTDGVSEAMNAAGEDFTEERLEKLVGRLSDCTASDMIQEVRSAVEDFCKGTQQSDDITMLVLKLA
ncbi:MAG: GAF domain-containing SpoIIE family protein phosphatase [Bacteroidota bacterium]